MMRRPPRVTLLLPGGQWHRDGVFWHAAKLPPVWHVCRVQSIVPTVLTSDGRTGPLLHCACGAVRRPRSPYWSERNSRRKSLAAARFSSI